MNLRVSLAVLGLQAVLFPTLVGAEEAGTYETFPEVGVKLRKPPGFERDKTFAGFSAPKRSASVLVTVLPGPFGKVSAGFQAEAMRARGWTLLATSDLSVDGRSGVLIHFEQPAGGQVFRKWASVFGNDEKTTLVTATYLMTDAADLSEPLKACVSSVALLRDAPPVDPMAEVPFRLAPSRKLKRAMIMQRGLFFTPNGKIEVSPAGDPFFAVSPSLGATPEASQAAAEARLSQTENLFDIKIAKTRKLKVSGRVAFESFAEAKHSGTGTVLAIYQLMLFLKDGYILAQGQVRAADADHFRTEFARLARSLRPAPNASW